MEINVTRFITEVSMWDLAHSAAEGGPSAGRDTWEAALEVSPEHMFVTDATRGEIQDWVADFGAWEREEIEGWDDVHLNALLLQFVAGDARESEAPGFGPKSQGGRFYRGDNGQAYFYVGC